MEVPNTLTVCIDNHERTIWRPKFPPTLEWWDERQKPRLLTIIQHECHLPSGDYLLWEFPDVTRIERKKDLAELDQNFLSVRDGPRWGRCWAKFQKSCQVPIVWIGMLDSSLYPTLPSGHHPGAVWSTVLRTFHTQGARLIVSIDPTTRSAKQRAIYQHYWGEVLLRYMLGVISATPETTKGSQHGQSTTANGAAGPEGPAAADPPVDR